MNIGIFTLKVLATLVVCYPTLFWFCSSVIRFLTFFNIFIMESQNASFQIIEAIIRVMFKLHDEPAWDYNPLKHKKFIFAEIMDYIFGSLLPLFLHIVILIIIW